MIRADEIGYVHSSRKEPYDDDWELEESRVVLLEEFAPEALQGLAAFSHAEIVFLFHEVDPAQVTVAARHPRNNESWPEVGIFAQRGRNRPNRIGTTICRIERVEGRSLYLRGLDAIDGTPVLDIKPVMREFLPREQVVQPRWATELMGNYWHRMEAPPIGHDDTPRTILCDLDGTLANIDHRLHHIRGGRRQDWDAFFRACSDDLPIRNTIHLVRRLHEVGFRVLIVSGRSDMVRAETERWLEGHGVPYDALVMRRDGDRRSDTVVKAEMVDELGIGPEDVLMVLDDRTKVVEMWRERGFNTFQVAPGDF